MRTVFTDAIVDMAAQEGLGIASECLRDLRNLVNDVVTQHGAELRDRDRFTKAYGDLQELVRRMIQDAKAKGYGELREDTLAAARSRCGLIFWCA